MIGRGRRAHDAVILIETSQKTHGFSRGMNGIVQRRAATSGASTVAHCDILLTVIAPSGATMTPNGVSTAGHAESHAWGDCVRHQRLRATVQRSPNQESHGCSRVECQTRSTPLVYHCGRKSRVIMVGVLVGDGATSSGAIVTRLTFDFRLPTNHYSTSD